MNSKLFSMAVSAIIAGGAFSASASDLSSRPGNRNCEERDFGRLNVRPGRTSSKNMRCGGGQRRIDQYYTGTSVLECDWDLRFSSAELTCYNPTGRSQDADHVFMTCCDD